VIEQRDRREVHKAYCVVRSAYSVRAGGAVDTEYAIRTTR
jgi:hypothetical protein